MLTSQTLPYGRIIELEVAEPVWSEQMTDNQRQEIQALMNQNFRLKKQEPLSGTMDIDQFTVNLFVKNQ